MRIVKKDVKPVLTAAEAFRQQRTNESGSYRLRQAVKNLLNEGKASTEVVAQVFGVIVAGMSSTGRITKADIEAVLPGFTTDP